MSDNDNNFETLRQILALKRHEIPPPGYFDDFSSGVISRIRAGEAVQKMPWLLRLLQAFEAKPAFPVAFASALCLLLLFGIVSIQQNPEFSNPTFPAVGDANSGLPDNPPIVAMVSTNPAVDISLFGAQQPVQPATLSANGN